MLKKTKKFSKPPANERILASRTARMRENLESSRRGSDEDPKNSKKAKASVVNDTRGKGQNAPTEILSSRMRRFSADLVEIGFTEAEAQKAAFAFAPTVKEMQRDTGLKIGTINEFMRHAFATAVGNNPRVFEKIKNDPVFIKEGVEGVIARRRSRAR